MTAAMQESRDKGRTKTNGESDASFGGLGARPAMEGWRWTDPFVGRRGGDATPGTALRCRRAGRALGFGVREVANPCPPPHDGTSNHNNPHPTPKPSLLTDVYTLLAPLLSLTT